MTTNFSLETFNILNFSKEEASRLHCGSVSPLHLLLGILRHTDNKAKQLLAYYLPDGMTTLKSQLEQTARQHQVLISPTPADMNFDTQANRIMRLCRLEASLMKSDSIEPIHVLLAILKANDNEASDILQRLDIPVDVGFGYQEMNTGENLFDISLSTQLFENRVLLGGNFGNRRFSTGSSAGDFMGNLDLQVKLDPEGNAQARFKRNMVKKIYFYCNRDGLFFHKL